MSRRSRAPRLLLASLLAVVGALLLTAAPALAREVHIFSTSFGSAGSAAGHFELAEHSGLAINSTTRDVYVADTNNHRVDQFSSSGSFIRAWGWGVSTGAAELQICTATCREGLSGSEPGQFEAPTFIAIDNDASNPSFEDVYVADRANHVVSKFEADGTPVASWGESGQIKDSPEGPFATLTGLAVDSAGDLDLLENAPQRLLRFEDDGSFVEAFETPREDFPGGLAVDSSGSFYKLNGEPSVEKFGPSGADVGQVSASKANTGLAVDSSSGGLYVDNAGGVIDHYGFNGSGEVSEPGDDTCAVEPHVGCAPTDEFGFGRLFGAAGLTVDPSNHTVYVADSGNSRIDVFVQAIAPDVTTNPPTNVGPISATLNGLADPAGGPEATDCHFVVSGGIGNVPCEQPTPISTATVVHAELTSLLVSTEYSYRLVVTNANGTTEGGEQALKTLPAVSNLSTGPATNLAASSVMLTGSFTGNGKDTSYYFEYGNDTSYGLTNTTPPGEDAGSPPIGQPHSLAAEISDLQSGVTYHYRVVATNTLGTTFGQDQTLTTPQSPTISGFSSSDLSATTADLDATINPNDSATEYHFEYGPTPSYGTRMPVPDATIEATGGEKKVAQPISGLQVGVTYHFRLIATNAYGTTTSEDQTFNFYPPVCPNQAIRQQTASNYLPDCRAYEIASAAFANGTTLFPANGPNTGQATNPSRLIYGGAFGSIPGAGEPDNTYGDLYEATRTNQGWITRFIGFPGNQASWMAGPPELTSEGSVATTEPNVDTAPCCDQRGVLTDPAMNKVLDWNEGSTAVFNQPDGNTKLLASNAPYLWSAEGDLLEHWPTNFAEVENGERFLVPNADNFEPVPPDQFSSRELTASADLTHFVFASTNKLFATGGVLGEPGSIYDDNTVAHTVTVASVTASQQENLGPGPLRIDAVSTNGSHILMETRSNSNTGAFGPLYMRVGGLITYEISSGHSVHYVGMTSDGSKVYFTSQEQLTPDDHNNSTDLYMWSEATDELTLASIGSDGASGGVEPISLRTFAQESLSGQGGNGTDDFIASENGDIYFYSLEQLDGAKGLRNHQNLYVYRNGRVQYVTTFNTGNYCERIQQLNSIVYTCTDGPVVRMQVSPDGSHMSFVTNSKLTSYENAGHTEMYEFEPATGQLACRSCNSSGDPATSDVFASENGLFMTDDGRVFFSTEEALVPRDTNNATDVYEFVNGRPQLITQGTGASDAGAGPAGLFGGVAELQALPGLVGVSANGTDVYFATFDHIVGQDQNGNQLKIYDARTDGGFPFVTPAAPCAAADECHGAGSLQPAITTNGTGADLGAGGNVSSGARHHQKKHKKSRRRQHTRHPRRPQAKVIGP